MFKKRVYSSEMLLEALNGDWFWKLVKTYSESPVGEGSEERDRLQLFEQWRSAAVPTVILYTCRKLLQTTPEKAFSELEEFRVLMNEADQLGYGENMGFTFRGFVSLVQSLAERKSQRESMPPLPGSELESIHASSPPPVRYLSTPPPSSLTPEAVEALPLPTIPPWKR